MLWNYVSVYNFFITPAHQRQIFVTISVAKLFLLLQSEGNCEPSSSFFIVFVSFCLLM